MANIFSSTSHQMFRKNKKLVSTPSITNHLSPESNIFSIFPTLDILPANLVMTMLPKLLHLSVTPFLHFHHNDIPLFNYQYSSPSKVPTRNFFALFSWCPVWQFCPWSIFDFITCLPPPLLTFLNPSSTPILLHIFNIFWISLPPPSCSNSQLRSKFRFSGTLCSQHQHIPVSPQ